MAGAWAGGPGAVRYGKLHRPATFGSMSALNNSDGKRCRVGFTSQESREGPSIATR